MSILKSVCFGAEGSYDVFGIPVRFYKSNYTPNEPNETGLITRLGNKWFNSNIFRWGSQAYAHLFVHEMSHAFMIKKLLNQTPSVYCNNDECTGSTIYSDSQPNDWENTLIKVAGPMGNVAFATCKLVAAKALENYLPWPVALTLNAGAVCWMGSELIGGYNSVTTRDLGDFDLIARRNKVHLAMAGTALVAQCALGIFVAVMVPSF